jgi:hypothetical protein
MNCDIYYNIHVGKFNKTFLEPSPNLLITAPRASKDLLIFAPSLSVLPLAPVLFCLSEPMYAIHA